jgi:hypothetical protein
MTDERVSADLRAEVAERARHCCEYCRSQERFAMQAFSVEHVVPRRREGETRASNLALACQGCNNHKYTRTDAPDPVTAALVPVFHPRAQRWSDHFTWNGDCTLILGLTPTGRATVEALCLNQPGLVNLRRILHAAGEHPPTEAD